MKKKKKVALMELTGMQQRFAEEYIKDWNGTKAVIRSGYSANGASVQATKLLAIPKIKDYINRFRYDNAEQSEARRNRIVAEFEKIAFDERIAVQFRQGALNSLAKIEGMFIETKIIQATLTIEDVLDQARKKINFEEAVFEEIEKGDTTKLKKL